MKSPQLRLAGAIVAVTCLLPVAGDAAEAVDASVTDDETTSKGTPAGYRTEQFRVRPTLSLTQQYDSNVFATASNGLADWITIISPQLKIDSTWDNHSLRFSAGAEAGRYWDYDAENYLDYWASAEGRYKLSDATDLFGGVGVSYEHEGRESPDATVGGLSPATYRSVNGHAGIKSRIGEVTYRLGGTYEVLDFNNVGSGATAIVNDDRDRELIGFGVRASHELDERNEIFAQAVYDVRDYDRERDQAGFQRDSDGYRAAVGVKSKLGGGNQVEGYVGILGQSYDDSRFDDVERFDFGGKATLIPHKSTRLTARLQRSLNETTLAGSPGYLSTALSGKAEYRATPRLTSHLSFRYAIADYLQSGREDDSYSAELGLRYFVTRNAYILTGVRHVVRDSNDVGTIGPSNDFEKNIFFLTFGTQGYPLFEPLISSFETEAEAEAGLLVLSDDATRFGRYSGLTEDGVEWNAGLRLHSTNVQRGWADIEGLNLGLDSRSLSIAWGSQGQYDAAVDYRQIPFNDFTGQTIFKGVGTGSLTLPGGWVADDETPDLTEIASNLSEVEIGTLRKRLAARTAIYTDDNNWTVRLGYQTETKEGIEQIAGVIGPSTGVARSSMLPTPVDYTTNTVKASLGYASGGTMIDIAYESAFFYNNLRSIAWDSPFDGTGPRGTNGEVSLPPDNQFHQLSLSGARTLFGTTRLTGMFSIGAMLQDEEFLPDTVAFATTPLPRDSLDGEVLLYNGLLSLSSRPLRGLNLKASYRMQQRDNNTPQDAFTYAVADSFGALTSTPGTDTNRPYSYDKRTGRVQASYRVNRMAKLSAEAKRETIERTPSEVHKTTEDSGELKLRLKPTDTVQVSLRGGAASREGSDYRTIAGENPLLRKYNISDRERRHGGLDLSYQASERFSLGAKLDVSDDDYDATRVGLADAKRIGGTLDVVYQVGQDLSTYAYLGREVYESNQVGSQVPNSPDWYVDNEDTVDSLGAGFRWKKNERLELGSDFVMSRSTGKTQMRSSNALPPVSQFPDLEANLYSLNLYADYEVSKGTSVKFTYRYEKYDAEEWSTDDVDVDTTPEVLLLGEGNPSYDQHVVGISLISRF